jgi:periplasmic protein TonB
MQRMFSDLVVSRGVVARRPGLALPASLVLHAAAVTTLLFIAVVHERAAPEVEPRPGRIPGFMPPPPADAGSAIRPSPPRPPRPAPPPRMAFVQTEPTVLPPPEDAMSAAQPGIDVGAEPPCLGCLPGVVPGGVPGGDPNGTGPGTPPPSPSTGPIRTGGDIHPPLKVRHVVPVYPEIARAARVQGDVVLDCTISNEGRVVDVKVLSGHALLQAAAVDAVRQWVYRPTLLNGVPVPVVMTVTVHFTLDRR